MTCKQHVINAVARLSKMVANRPNVNHVATFTFDGVHNVFGHTSKAAPKLERIGRSNHLMCFPCEWTSRAPGPYVRSCSFVGRRGASSSLFKRTDDKMLSETVSLPERCNRKRVVKNWGHVLVLEDNRLEVPDQLCCADGK